MSRDSFTKLLEFPPSDNGRTSAELLKMLAADDRRRERLKGQNGELLPRVTAARFSSPEELAALDPPDSPRRFVGCVMEGLDLSQLDLSYSIFDGCQMAGCRFWSCRKTEWYSCDLRGAHFTGADFRWARMRGCRVDGADFLGIQTTFDCHFWAGIRSELERDYYLLLYWLALSENPVTHRLAEREIPSHVRHLLDKTFHRDL